MVMHNLGHNLWYIALLCGTIVTILINVNSYRPISSLTFVSKILKGVTDSRIVDHANSIGLFSPVQSVYRKHHSTETALVNSKSTMILFVVLTEVKWVLLPYLTFPQHSIE